MRVTERDTHKNDEKKTEIWDREGKFERQREGRIVKEEENHY